jgi:uncharacterized protein with GYD domain
MRVPGSGRDLHRGPRQLEYITLGHLTDQGVRHAKEAPKRKQMFRDLAQTFGATVEAVYWTMGQYISS